MINNIQSFAKFLDQPMLIAKLDKNMPKIMLAATALYSAKKGYDIFEKTKNTTDENKKAETKNYLKNTAILFSSVACALLAPKLASKITGRSPLKPLNVVQEQNSKLIDEFISNNKNSISAKSVNILSEAKTKILSFSKVKSLLAELKEKKFDEFVSKLIPDPENISSKDIFSEIGYLSIYGAIPVVGGILSGIAADKITGEDVKKTAPDKISEGLYQYLANIFMCNVGAGAALAILEKLNITSKACRALGMVAGIVLTGVVGGSKIANFITSKMSKLVGNKEIKERKPELMDLGMHTDDIATVAVLSGLKWIEPSLPTLYSISGYKSGIGYRN